MQTEPPPDSDARYATYVVDSLLRSGRVDTEPGDDLVISDVEADAIEFGTELDMLGSAGIGVPTVQLEDGLVPVALRVVAGADPAEPAERPASADELRSYLAQITGGPRGFAGYDVAPPDVARDAFRDRAIDFLAERFGALRDLRSGDPARWGKVVELGVPHRLGAAAQATPGCVFQVSTNTPGIRVHWSGAYRITWIHFGRSTPVSNVLQAGTYVFGVDDPHGPGVLQDRAVVRLPGPPSLHLNH